jgi:hypothetical protein
MGALQVFDFEKRPVRVTTTDGETWWVAKDVCDVLDITDSKQACDRLDTDERGRCSIPTPGGNQKVRAVNESGLYSLVLSSRKPQARAFKRWVCHEVLPAIRSTGSYSLDGVKAPTYAEVGALVVCGAITLAEARATLGLPPVAQDYIDGCRTALESLLAPRQPALLLRVYLALRLRTTSSGGTVSVTALAAELGTSCYRVGKAERQLQAWGMLTRTIVRSQRRIAFQPANRS